MNFVFLFNMKYSNNATQQDITILLFYFYVAKRLNKYLFQLFDTFHIIDSDFSLFILFPYLIKNVINSNKV